MLPGVGSDFGRYRITGRLGRGGMGVVFSAVHRDLDRPVALKLLTPDLSGDDSYRHRFLREARILARLDSPHIVRVYDTGEQDGWLFIATQLINGGDLKQVLDTTGPLPIDASVELVAQIAEGLAEAHEAGILHRDIKPSNVLLRQRSDGRRQAILCDLGIATLAGADSTLTVGVIGTPTYMSPERHQGEDATVASDIYALGCLLWATITGGPPYQGTPAEIFRGHVHGQVPQLQPGAPHAPALNKILATSMAKDPAERYASVADLLTALREVDPLASPRSYRDETTDTQRPAAADGTIVVPYVESVGVVPAAPGAGFVGADAVPVVEPSVEVPGVPDFEPSVEVPLPPPSGESSGDLPPPPGFRPSAERSVESAPAVDVAVPPPPPPPAPPPTSPPAVDEGVEEDELPDTAASAWAAGVAPPPPGPAPSAAAAPPVAAATVAVPGAELTNERPPGAPPPPPPPPGTFSPAVPPPAPQRGRRKGAVLVGVVALAVAAVAAAILVVVAPWTGSDKPVDDAVDAAGAETSTTTEPSSSPTADEPPPAPRAPKVSAKPGYRSVAFTVAAVGSPDGYDVAYQRRDGRKWVEVDRRFSLPTREGGDKECAVVRATLTGEGGTSEGKTARECGKSEPKDLRVVQSELSCESADLVAGYTCRVYAVEIEGFEPGTTQYMTIAPCAYSCEKPLRVGKDGRARLERAAVGYTGNTVEVSVGKLFQRVFVGG